MSEAPRPEPLPTARAVLWHPIGEEAPSPAEQPYPIFFHRNAIVALHEHQRAAGAHGVFGFLAGTLLENPETGTPYIVIDKVLRLNQPVSGDKTLMVVERLWNKVQQQLERASIHLLGWYHSHAEPGIALSAGDVATHEKFFPDPWQVALLLGTAGGGPAGGFFQPETGEGWEETCVAFYELVGDEQPLINWTTYETATPPPATPPATPPPSRVTLSPPATFPAEFEVEHHAAAVPPPPVAHPTAKAEKPTIPLLYEPEQEPPTPSPPPSPPPPAPERAAAPRKVRARGPRRRRRWGRLVLRLAVLAVLAGAGVAAWYLGLVQQAWQLGPVQRAVAQFEAARARMFPPAPAARPAPRAATTFARLDRVSDSLARAMRGYQDRAALFPSGRIDCAGLARSLATVERLWLAYSAERRARGARFDAERTRRDQRLYAGVDSVETRFERSGCARP